MPGRLFLLEDDPGSDKPHPSYLSAFSTPAILSEIFHPRLLWTPAQTNVAVRELDKRFADDPITALERLGARRLTNRWITALYRIRTGTEMVIDDQRSKVVTFGYPIAILSGHVRL